MSEILTGNVLSDGILYHASDINAAINGATLLQGVMDDKQVIPAAITQRMLVQDESGSGSLAVTNMQGIITLLSTNLQTKGNLDAHEGISFSGYLSIAVAGTLNDWSPVNFGKSTIINMVGSATLTGMTAPPAVGTLKILHPASGTITLKKEDPGSIAANRLYWSTAATLTMTNSEVAVFCYFNTRWLLIASTKNF